jgi:bisphosphoglycerate-dependent phosphoglycerate mutase
MSKSRIDYVKREVINDQLLAALDDKSKCAIVASEDDVRMLIRALSSYGKERKLSEAENEKRAAFIYDLTQLLAKAFGG